MSAKKKVSTESIVREIKRKTRRKFTAVKCFKINQLWIYKEEVCRRGDSSSFDFITHFVSINYKLCL